MTTEIIEALKVLSDAQKRVIDIRSNCKHTIKPTDPGDLECSSRICDDCGQEWHDWYCQENAPTFKCEYTDENGECCIHCGKPWERL